MNRFVVMVEPNGVPKSIRPYVPNGNAYHLRPNWPAERRWVRSVREMHLAEARDATGAGAEQSDKPRVGERDT